MKMSGVQNVGQMSQQSMPFAQEPMNAFVTFKITASVLAFLYIGSKEFSLRLRAYD
jgi:hypothetical protein